MRRFVTALSVAALAFGFVAQTAPAAAVTGFDSAYSGESAFLTLNPGQTGTFTVFFANTGTATWVNGTSTQVDLAACLEDKVTCDQQDAGEAPYNAGWKSATRYATATQSTVSPGQIATFNYSVTVPSNGSGLHRFNGALVLSVSGADIHNEGYYQEIQVVAPTASGINVTPDFLQANTASAAAGLANENRGVREYTVTLGPEVPIPVRIAIFSAACVTGPIATATYRFNDSNGDRKADDSACNTKTDAFIQQVNGLTIGGQQINVEASPPQGSNKITFSLNYRGTSNAQVKPVVWKDANGDTLVELDTPPCCGAADTNLQARAVTGAGKNTEAVGVGGETDWNQPGATLGSYSCSGAAASSAAAAALTNEGRVRFVDTTLNYADVTYTVAGTLVEYRFDLKTIDQFLYMNTSQDTNTSFGAAGPGLTITQFKQSISPRDRVTINYNPDPGAQSSWTFCADRPDRPATLTASITDAPSSTGSIFAQQAENCVTNCSTGTAETATAQTTAARGSTQDADTDVDDVILTFAPAPNPCVKSYFVFRQISSDSGINWQQTEVVTANGRVTNAGDTTVNVYDLDVPAGFHRWGVVSKVDDVDTTTATTIDCGNGAIDASATGDATGSTKSGSAVRYSNALTTMTPVGATTGAPQSNDMFISKSGGLNAQLDTGDIFKIVFSQIMNTDSTGKVIQFKDGDGTTMTLRCDGNAAPNSGDYGAICNFNTADENVKGTTYVAGRVATVTIVGTNTPATSGTTTGMQYPTSAIDQGGWVNTEAKQWDIASSPDKTLEQP
jgi:hypothetical protein